ncbi:MAG: DUF2207 domain-containing protein [Pseudomonadota bacterium]|nr:DUF2207 domain-containing protein [Pseudomonadota bacterium]
MMRWLLIALLVSALSYPLCTLAQERIVSYDSRVEVRTDGSLDVTETIRVRAEGSDIRRGIYRDFPTRYRDARGNRVVVDFDVIDVRRDGRPEPWFVEGVANGVRINTGDDSFLRVPAEYTYTLRYRTTRQIGFFNKHDELYWNAIGHGWAFPIASGTVEVRLPEAVPASKMATDGYSGAFGDRGTDFDTSYPAPGVARWELRRPLSPREGLTVVLGFPKGVVTPPSWQQRLAWFFGDNRGVLIALLGLLALLVYCVRRWRQVGRDPPAGTIIVRYEPPPGYSPAGLRYISRMKYDSRCLSADLLACAVEGAVFIEREKRRFVEKWQVHKTAGDEVSTLEQRVLLEQLFSGGRTTLEVDNANAAVMQAVIKRHRGTLDTRFQPALFARNGRSIAVAAAITGATAILALGLGGGGGIPAILVVLALMVLALVVFSGLIKAPTLEGRLLMDEIAGFKRYLSVADREELARLAAPGDARPSLDAGRFERLLPHAVALDVEEAWTSQFTLAVGTAAAAEATAALPWFHGGSSGNPGSFAGTIGSSLDSQISASSTPPGSSSGGGGGGSSGGGGGGGGGGGR